MKNTSTTTKSNGTSKRGFASMSSEKVHEIASKGGHASAEKAGHKGMAERGHEGGIASTQNASHEELARRGHLGGIASAASRRQAKKDAEYEGDDGYDEEDDTDS